MANSAFKAARQDLNNIEFTLRKGDWVDAVRLLKSSTDLYVRAKVGRDPDCFSKTDSSKKILEHWYLRQLLERAIDVERIALELREANPSQSLQFIRAANWAAGRAVAHFPLGCEIEETVIKVKERMYEMLVVLKTKVETTTPNV